MKYRIVFFTIISILLCNNAQSEDYSKFLNLALERLEQKDCETAKKFYNVYKDLSGKRVNSIEVMIDDCNKKNTYAIGDKIIVDGTTYTVAYLMNDKLHGLAVCYNGRNSLSNRLIKERKIPTIKELREIYTNRYELGLFDNYWSCSHIGIGNEYYTYDFNTGNSDYDNKSAKNGILLIHRF